jgi:ABC-type sugar transport system permease subunit
LFLSALQGISSSLYESAKVDGANSWETFWKITLPMVKPIMLVNIVYTLCNSFTDKSNPIIAYTQQRAFKDLKFTESAAIGVLYLLFVLVLIIIVFLILGRKKEND